MSVSSNDFSISIISPNVKQIVQGKYNYFSLPNFSEYKLKLINNRPTRCDAVVSIDGEDIGTWRVNAYSSIMIERPANVNRRFIFVKEFYKKSHDIDGVDVGRIDPNNGVITVVFKPEYPVMCPYESVDYINTPTTLERWSYGSDLTSIRPNLADSVAEYQGSNGIKTRQMAVNRFNTEYGSGATILGAGTDQNFNTTARIYKYDTDNITSISLRLIITQHKPYTSLRDGLGLYQRMPPHITRDYRGRDAQVYGQLPITNLVDRYYDVDRILIEKPYYFDGKF